MATRRSRTSGRGGSSAEPGSSTYGLPVTRLLAPVALLAVAIATAFTVGVVSTDETSAGAAPGMQTVVAPPLSPLLRPVGDLALPGGPGQVDSGVGVYPQLSAAERLTFPAPEALAAARRYARGRDGDVAFAVLDDRGGLRGLHARSTFPSASLSKAMILVAYLRKLAAEGAELSDSDLLGLGYMIRLSDNDSASTYFARVGDRGLIEVARLAGMKDFAVAGDWANATVTAADQARFFSRIDRLVPRRFRGLARNLLGSVSELQAWGIPAGAPPAWQVFFKGGWRPESDGEMVHQAALLEQGRRRVAIAVMTVASPDMVYGERSIQGVARRLLAGAPSALLPVNTVALKPLRPPAVLARSETVEADASVGR